MGLMMAEQRIANSQHKASSSETMVGEFDAAK
jgi:hypothetical protein